MIISLISGNEHSEDILSSRVKKSYGILNLQHFHINRLHRFCAVLDCLISYFAS